jgi:S1-C subfamily serine protease
MGRRWVRVLRVDTVRDLALLETVPGPVRGLRLRPVETGESVVIIGHPVGLPYVTHRGIVSRGEREEEGRRYFLTDAGIVPGMSGGPVFDEYGDVVGIASFSVGYFLVPQAHLGGAVPVSAILEFLEE